MEPFTSADSPSWRARWLGLAFVTFLAYFTYVSGYAHPPALFWDENYHVASAQKYLNRVHFMEPHPPLGKLLVALGEWWLQPNARTDQFIGTDYARDLPPGFSFAGFRLVPALLGWLTAPLVFLILLRLIGNPLHAVLLSFLYVFDNALLVHLRGAMLEGPLLFFTSAALLSFLLVFDSADRPRRLAASAVALGLCLGLAIAVKLVALALGLLIPAALVRLWPRWRQCAAVLLLSGGSLLLAFGAVWQVHFALGVRLVPSLKNEGYYLASDAYKEVLAQGRQASITAFPIMLWDSIRFVQHYERGVPELDLCKPGENGSPFYAWPIGARTINYRWETPDGQAYRYLYLQSNPAVWATGLLGVALALGVLVASARRPGAVTSDTRFLLLTFLGLYLAYMLAVSRVPRVMYLYHYFIPLLLSFCLFALALAALARAGWLRLNERRVTVAVHVLAALVLVTHHFYRPLTYYQPLTHAQFQRRALLPPWDLRCASCHLASWWCRR